MILSDDQVLLYIVSIPIIISMKDNKYTCVTYVIIQYI